jgi:hypothetical protein
MVLVQAVEVDVIHSYGKIYALGHGMIAELFLDPVVVEEKIDGSQFSFGVFGGELICRSKNVVVPEGDAGMFAAAVATARELAPVLREGWTYRGEYLRAPKHGHLAYDRVPSRHVMIFDVDTGTETYLMPEQRSEEAARLGLEVVPTVFSGMVESADDIIRMMSGVSALGGQKPEGLVFKNYHRCGPDKKTLRGKYVDPQFAEVQKKEWKSENPKQGDILAILGEKYRTKARWYKAVQHLREDGRLTQSPKDIGTLLLEAKKDIESECAEEIKAQLYKWAIGSVLRQSVAGLPEWYKEYLLSTQFEPANDNGDPS